MISLNGYIESLVAVQNFARENNLIDPKVDEDDGEISIAVTDYNADPRGAIAQHRDAVAIADKMKAVAAISDFFDIAASCNWIVLSLR